MEEYGWAGRYRWRAYCPVHEPEGLEGGRCDACGRYVFGGRARRGHLVWKAQRKARNAELWVGSLNLAHLRGDLERSPLFADWPAWWERPP